MPANDVSNFIPPALQFSRDMWQEKIAGFKPGGEDVFSIENSEAVLVGVIPMRVAYSFLLAAYGFSYVDTATLSLRRVLPLFHPIWTWMTATAVSIQAKEPLVTEKEDLLGYGDGSIDRSTRIEPIEPDIAFDYGGYNLADVTIKFSQQPFEYVSDDEGVTEYQRYFGDISRNGSIEFLALQNGQLLTFTEGTTAGDHPPIIGTSSPTTLNVQMFKDVISFKWYQVPKDYIMSSSIAAFQDGFDATKISACVGCVNDAPFLGFRAGTLLLHPPTYERFLWPIRTNTRDAYGYNVIFQFQHFDPKRGADYAHAFTDGPIAPSFTSPYYGHNLQPYSSRNNDADPRNGFWYYANRGGQPNNQPYWPTADFTQMFTHVDDV